MPFHFSTNLYRNIFSRIPGGANHFLRQCGELPLLLRLSRDFRSRRASQMTLFPLARLNARIGTRTLRDPRQAIEFVSERIRFLILLRDLFIYPPAIFFPRGYLAPDVFRLALDLLDDLAMSFFHGRKTVLRLHRFFKRGDFLILQRERSLIATDLRFQLFLRCFQNPTIFPQKERVAPETRSMKPRHTSFRRFSYLAR